MSVLAVSIAPPSSAWATSGDNASRAMRTSFFMSVAPPDRDPLRDYLRLVHLGEERRQQHEHGAEDARDQPGIQLELHLVRIPADGVEDGDDHHHHHEGNDQEVAAARLRVEPGGHEEQEIQLGEALADL